MTEEIKHEAAPITNIVPPPEALKSGAKFTSASKVTAGQTKKSKAGGYGRKKYMELKRRTLKKEEENFTQIICMKSTDAGWWKIFGHSAVFYKFHVAKRLGLKIRIMSDNDYDEKSPEGVVSISDIDQLIKRMARAKIYPSYNSSVVVIFDLGERITREDYLAMVDEEALYFERANKLVMPEERLVTLNAKAKEMHAIIHECVRKMDGETREAFAAKVDGLAAEAQCMVVRAARGTMDMDVLVERLMDISEELYGYTTVMTNLRLIEARKIYDLTVKVVAFGEQVKKEARKRETEKADAKLKKKVKENTKSKKEDKDNGETEENESAEKEQQAESAE